MAFILPSQAFAEQNRDHAGLWMGSLIHSIADEAACNHDPLIHLLTHAFGAKEYRIKMGRGIGMDLGDLAATPAGRTPMAELLKGYQPALLSPEPAQALITLMMTTVRGNDWMTQRGAAIAATYSINSSLRMEQQGRRALAELGMWSTRVAGDDECQFCFGAKYLLSAVMRELKNNTLPCRPLDVRKVSPSTMSPPAKMPVLIVCAGGFRLSAPALQSVKGYAQPGGKLLWIAGQHPGFMSELSRSLTPLEERLAPVFDRALSAVEGGSA